MKATPMGTSLAKSTATPGPSEDGYYVKITHVPEGVSPAQVILLFTHTARIAAEMGERYEFVFSELCPSVVYFDNRIRARQKRMFSRQKSR